MIENNTLALWEFNISAVRVELPDETKVTHEWQFYSNCHQFFLRPSMLYFKYHIKFEIHDSIWGEPCLAKFAENSAEVTKIFGFIDNFTHIFCKYNIFHSLKSEEILEILRNFSKPRRLTQKFCGTFGFSSNLLDKDDRIGPTTPTLSSRWHRCLNSSVWQHFNMQITPVWK